ncbi:hypothetical protein Bca101_023624 [Brassica carinata]
MVFSGSRFDGDIALPRVAVVLKSRVWCGSEWARCSPWCVVVFVPDVEVLFHSVPQSVDIYGSMFVYALLGSGGGGPVSTKFLVQHIP